MENRNDQNRAPWWQPGLVLFTKLSGWIAGPVILGIIIGKWLDKKYGTEPWLFLISVGTAFFLSMFGIVHDSLKEMKRIEKEEKEKKEKSKAEISNNKSNPKSN
jgi:F0F1-type ATP synthase assembly protein I